MTIRDAAPGDREAVLPLWEALLAGHGIAPDPATTRATWALLMDPASPMKMRVAERGGPGEIVGFATHVRLIASWSAGWDGCLDGLYVAPSARRLGLGRALIDDLLALAAQRGWRSVFWHVHADNAAARALYDGLAQTDDYLRYRVPIPGTP